MSESVPVLFVVEPDSLLLDIAGPADAFRCANATLHRSRQPVAFDLRYVGAEPEHRSSVGLAVAGLEPLPATLPANAWVVLVGKAGVRRPGSVDRPVSDWLRAIVRPALEADACRVITICEGALTAGAAGLLDGRHATTHHEALARLRTIAPHAHVDENRVYVIDGPVATCAGAAAGMDVALALIASHCGDALASAVAATLNVYIRRGPDDPERSPMLMHRNHLSAAVHRTQNAVTSDLLRRWTADELAAVAGTSARHLDRLFLEHTGVLPRTFVQTVRVERARTLIGAGATVAVASRESGFGSEPALRRAWRDHLGGTPSDVRT